MSTTVGSWKRLSAAFPQVGECEGATFSRESVQIGNVVFKNSVKVVVGAAGLSLSRGRLLPFLRAPKAIQIPWGSIMREEGCRLYWVKSYRLFVGDPLLATVIVSSGVYERVYPYLSHSVGHDGACEAESVT